LGNIDQLHKSLRISLQKIKDTTSHVHHGIEILLVIKGNVCVDCLGRTYKLGSNDLILINRGHVHSLTSQTDNLILSLYMDYDFLSENFNQALSYTFICNSTLEDVDESKFQFIRKLMTQIMLLDYKKEIGYNLLIKSKIYKLLYHIVTNFKYQINNIDQPKEVTDERIKRILHYISNNYMNNITLGHIAEREYISIHYLSRLFKSQVGINFQDYLSQIRLEKAVELLIKSHIPINKIALKCGFPNIQSFNREFKRKFNENPSEYRNKNKLQTDKEKAEIHDIQLDKEQKLSVVLDYIMSNDLMDEKDVVDPPLDIDFNKKLEEKRLNKIIRIGGFDDLLNKITQVQIKEAAKELNFQYIYFTDLFNQTNLNIHADSLYRLDEIISSLNLIISLNLIPIVEINLNDYIHKLEINQNISGMVLNIFNLLKRHYSTEYLSSWHLVFRGTSLHKAVGIVEELVNELNNSGFNNKIGITLSKNLNQIEEDGKLIAEIKEKNIQLGFVCLESSPDEEDGKAEYVDHHYYEGYLKNQIKRVRRLLNDRGLYKTKIIITNFNTLAGSGLELAGTFFRAALILDTIVNSTDKDVSFSFWLSNKSYEKHTKHDGNHLRALSLYLFQLIKRPVYFLLKFLNKCGAEFKQVSDNIIIANKDKSYYILAFNPYYYNPLYSLAENYISINRRNMELTIKGLKKGEYLIKKHTLDKHKGGKFEALLSLMSMTHLDKETLDFIERSNIPDMKISKQEIKGEFKITASISSNAVVLYEFIKMD